MFHYVGHMTYGSVDLNGSLQIPLFFLLSGFSLSIAYTERQDLYRKDISFTYICVGLKQMEVKSFPLGNSSLIE